MTNPFFDLAPAGPPKQAQNPFFGISQPDQQDTSAEPDLTTGTKRQAFNRQSMLDTRDRLKSIVPKDDGHKRRLERLINSIDLQLADKGDNRSAIDNFVRGTASGVWSGAEFPVELAGNVLAMTGHRDLQKYIEENRNLLQEELDPQGKAGFAGELAGGILGSAPAAGGAATATGKLAVRLLPGTRIARAIAAAAEGTMGQRVGANIITGLPINAIQAGGAPEMEVPEGATPEERDRISTMNTANKIKNLAIGIGADALFGALPLHGRRGEAGGDAPKSVEMTPADVAITPERQAQLDQVKAQASVKAALKRRERLDKSLAQSEWQIMNPDLEWKELNPTTKRKVYDDFKDRRRNSNPNTSTDGNPPEMQQQVVSMDEQLKAIRGERDDARRLAETDDKLGIGNDRALMRASGAADKDPNMVYVMTDINGLKSVNDKMGYEAGDQLLRDSRDALVGAHEAQGVKPRIFRYGGDELIALVPKDKAALILDGAEKNSIKQYGDQTGSMSGAVHETLADALSTEGKAKLVSRKIEAKARQNIPGRSNEEQALIDAARERINTAPQPAQVAADITAGAEAAKPVEAQANYEANPQDPFPPEVMQSIHEVQRGGGLQSDAEMQAFTEELHRLYSVDMEPGKRASELQTLVEDFTPLEKPDAEPAPKAAVEAPPAPAPAAPKETRLQTLDHAKPLEKMTDRELSRIDDKITDAMDSVPPQSAEKGLVQRDFDLVRDEYARRNAGQPKTDAVASHTPDIKDYASGRVQADVGAPPKADLPVTQRTVDPEVGRIVNKPARKMSDSELNTSIAAAEYKRDAMLAERDLGAVEEIQKTLNKFLTERALRDKVSNGIVAQVPKSGLEGAAGFAFGFSSAKDPEDEADRATNGLMWAAIAMTGGLAIARMHAKVKSAEVKIEPSDSWAGSEIADKKIVHYSDIEEKPTSWRERAREWYSGIARRSFAIDRAVNVLTGSDRSAAAMAAHKNPAKLAAMFGRWVSMSEGALMDKPVYLDYAGNVMPLPAPSFREIMDMVSGDIKGLGKLMTARTSIEGAGTRTVPLDPVTSDLIFHSAPEEYHKAADAMRQFDLSMTMVLENAGVLTPGSKDRFAQEEFYAGLKKVFDPDAGPSKIVRDPKTRKMVISQNPVKGRKQGTSSQVYNPAETTASMVPQVYRAAELNEIKGRLVDLWEAGGKPDFLLKQVERRRQPISVDQQLRIDALKQEIKGMTQADAESLVAAFDPKSLDPRSNVMTVYREGTLRAYKVDEDIAQAMTSLTPDELEGMWKVLGMPANIARQGVVLNPYFVAKQAFIDGWQATLNSSYGFRPGVDQFLGWMNIVRDTPEYRTFVSAGGGHSTLQSHDYANVKTALAAVVRGGGGPFEIAVKQAKEFKLLDAYRTLIVPFAESARVGEYLRARNHGASALDAVYAAKHVTANFQQHGGFTAIRGLNTASMFLNPAIQGLDQAMFRAGINPMRVPEEGRKAAAAKYLSKAFVGITLPSMAFWMLNKDDKEINDLRKTPSGAKYWFMRSPVDNGKMGLKKGDIVKIPKPIVDGQIFGTSMEAYLDKAYGDDPAQMSAAVSAMAKDVSFNILPTAGVLYYGLQTNQNLGTGSPLSPPGDDNLSMEHRGEDKASWVARTVSEKVAPIVGPNSAKILQNTLSPAGLDFVMTTVGGMLGQDGLLAVTQAVEAETKGYVPAKEELPVVSKIFATYPASNVAPIRDFYDRAQQVQEVGATINHLVKEDPTRLLPYMGSNQADYVMLGLYTKARQDIANYRRAYQDIKDAPAGTMTSDDRRTYMKQYQTLMIETARQVNTFTREVDKSIKNP